MIELVGVPSMRWRRTAICTVFVYFMLDVHFVGSWIGYRSGDFCCRNLSFVVSVNAVPIHRAKSPEPERYLRMNIIGFFFVDLSVCGTHTAFGAKFFCSQNII